MNVYSVLTTLLVLFMLPGASPAQIQLQTQYKLNEKIVLTAEIPKDLVVPKGASVLVDWDSPAGVESQEFENGKYLAIWPLKPGSYQVTTRIDIVDWENRKFIRKKFYAKFQVGNPSPRPDPQPNPNPDPQPDPQPNSFQAKVEKAFFLVSEDGRNLKRSVAGEYARLSQEVQESPSAWTIDKVNDVLQTRMSKAIQSKLKAWTKFWPAVGDAIASEKIPSDDVAKYAATLQKLSSALSAIE